MQHYYIRKVPSMKFYNPLSAQPVSGPASKAFEPHELRRIPVTLTDAAQQVVLSSSAEGRIFPQALSELFGGVEGVKELQIDAVVRSQHFPSGPEHFHPITGEEDRMLVIDVVHENGSIDAHRYVLNVRDLQEVHPAGRVGFTAVATAQELVRLYPHRK